MNITFLFTMFAFCCSTHNVWVQTTRPFCKALCILKTFMKLMTYCGQLKKNWNRFSFNLTCICTVLSLSVAAHMLQFIEVSVEAMESANSLDIAFSALFILDFLPIKDFLGGYLFDCLWNDCSAWWWEE